MRISRDSDSDPCPVTDDLLGELYRANKNGLPELIATVSPDVRAALAMYCYRRGHLKSIGLAIASTCELYDLETVGRHGGRGTVCPLPRDRAGGAGRVAIRGAAEDHARQRLAAQEPADRRRGRAGRHRSGRRRRSGPLESAALKSKPVASAPAEPEPPKSVPPNRAPRPRRHSPRHRSPRGTSCSAAEPLTA